jgi:hypothetical protein
MAKLNYNPELVVGDRVICISMDDEYAPVYMGTAGIVRNVNVIFGDTQYSVDWDNGSKLSLISGIDKWVKEEDMKNRSKKKTQESVNVITKKNFLKENFFMENKDLFKYFRHSLLHKFLSKLRDSGVTNMLGAAPYMYMGSERIEHEHKYDETNESFDEVVDIADDVRDELIRGSMKLLESQGKEITPSSVQRVMQTYARKMVIAYTKFAGGHLNIN